MGKVIAHNFFSLVGQQFGRLTVLQDAGRTARNSVIWLCQCECGEIIKTGTSKLRSGHTRSCGCLGREQALSRLDAFHKTSKVHGETHANRTKEYKAWGSMKERCLNPLHPSYARYGGRGIKICGRWVNDYLAFLNDMGRSKPSESLDRIDVNGNYEPSNCRWVDSKVQGRNKTNTKYMSIGGIKYKAIDVANTLGVDRNLIYTFLKIDALIKEKYVLV